MRSGSVPNYRKNIITSPVGLTDWLVMSAVKKISRQMMDAFSVQEERKSLFPVLGRTNLAEANPELRGTRGGAGYYLAPEALCKKLRCTRRAQHDVISRQFTIIHIHRVR